MPARYEGVIVQPDHESRVKTQAKPVGADWFYSRFPIDGSEEVLSRFRPGMVSVVPGAAADFVLPMAQVAPQYRKTLSAMEVRRVQLPMVQVLLSGGAGLQNDSDDDGGGDGGGCDCGDGGGYCGDGDGSDAGDDEMAKRRRRMMTMMSMTTRMIMMSMRLISS